MDHTAPTDEGAPAAGASGPGLAESLSGIALAILGVTAVSTSAVLIRLAGSISAAEIAFWRLVVSVAVLAPPMVLTGAWQAVRPIGYRRFAVYGAFLASHFASYNLALQYAPIAHVLPILYTSTIAVAILSASVLKESLRLRQVVGTLVVILGIAVLAGFEPGLNRSVLLGDALALLSALALALYSIAGRRERNRVPLLAYAVGVYALAALWTSPFAAGLARGGYSTTTVLALLGLGVVPNAIGHTLFNASIRRMNATVANVLFTQEITVAILLGWLLLGEEPSVNAAVGAVIMVVGILAVLI